MRRVFFRCLVVILSVLLSEETQGQECNFDLSSMGATKADYKLFLSKLNNTIIRPEKLIRHNDFDIIHFKSTIDLAKKVFNEELEKLNYNGENNRLKFEHNGFTNGVAELSSKCSVDCGPGVKVITRIICKSLDVTNNCGNPKIISEIKPCNVNLECPTIEYGPWSEWSSCSASCVKSIYDVPNRVRIRTCKEPCSGFGTIEKRPCDVPSCPPTCPEYTATLDRDISNDLKVSVLITVTPPEQSFAQYQRQEITLRDVFTNEIVDNFNVTAYQTIRRTNLKINSAYVPEIRVITEVNSFLFEPTSILVHHCQGRVLHCDFFVCDDGTRILAEELCNNEIDCEDSSDERADICTGTFGLPLVIFTLLLFLYIIIGVGVFLSQNKETFFVKEDAPQRSEDELKELRNTYASLHASSSTWDFLEVHKDDRQVLLQVVQPVELQLHGHVCWEALECLKKTHVIAGGNMIVMSSLSGRIRARIPFRLRRIACTLNYCLMSAYFYFDVYKDVAFIFALNHISSQILHFRFGNNLRLDLLAGYILILVISCQCCLHLYSFAQRRKEPDRWMALLFPIINAFNKDKLYAELQLIETFFERVPQLMVILCLWNESEKNYRLGLLLFSVLEGKLGLPAKFIFILSLVTTYVGVLRSSMRLYDRKRLPLTPSGTGRLIQYFLFSSLLIPKTIVTSWVFKHYPYFYPTSMLAEMFLIACLYKIPLAVTRITPCNLEIVCASVIAPVFYRSSKICLLQNIALFSLTFMAIYIPCFYLFRVHLEVDPFIKVSISDFIMESLSFYGPGGLLYLVFGTLFYLYGHNWAKLIRTNKINFLNIPRDPNANKMNNDIS